MESVSDSTLMERVQSGDTAQLAMLFERHHIGLFRYAMHLTRNRPLSEDIVQEVFFRVLKYARSYNSELSFPVWLYGMTRNAYYDWLRKNGAEISSDGLPEVRSPDPMLEEVMTQKQDKAFLEEALRQLPQDKREVLVLSRFHDMRYEEIASLLQCEVGTVKVRVFRALKELREKFCALRGEKLYDI